MTPSLRPLQPLLQTTTLRWSSRPRTSHAFQIQQYLLYGTKREEEGYLHLVPYRSSATHKELLRMWRFPRKYKPIYSSIWWTMKWTPRFLKWLIVLGVQYPSWRMQNPRNAVVKSRTGRFFYELVFTQPGFYDLINTTIQPWGFITLPTGTSMQPTFSGNPSISFTSFAYTGIEDVSIGDVVTVLAPDYDAGKGFLGKRVAALDGARIYVAKGPNGTPEIIRVHPSCSFGLLGSVSR